MKRYLLFVFEEGNAAGGWNDYVDSYNTTDEAIEASKQKLGIPVGGMGDTFQVIDTLPMPDTSVVVATNQD